MIERVFVNRKFTFVNQKMKKFEKAKRNMFERKYENLNGIRVYACTGIVLMRVLRDGYLELSGIVFERFIPSFINEY